MTKVHPDAALPDLDTPRCSGPPVVFTVWRKSLVFSCSGFTVFDAQGNLVFRVDNYASGSNSELVLMDAAGKPLLTVRRKKLSLGEKWSIYNGEEAVDPRFTVKKHVNLRQAKAIAHVTPSRAGGGGGYEVEGSYARRSCCVYDEQRRTVAEIRQKEAVSGVAFGGEVFRLVVDSELEAGLAMAVVIVLDKMFGSRS
ncbi:hypothetical protein Cni_G25881 [Canna indica]|uniref:Protein LURP-one-related 8 n=1 Tax=Canna indica TaxID=4628 RepID=A0AAQ3L0T6_9LILI|nr:hypothetical protein Cni_G25881 [Canna indica]